MSLWKNNDGANSAPLWYARNCVFDGTGISEGKIVDLSKSSRGFTTGDAVIYLASSVASIGGLTDQSTYYLREVAPSKFTVYDTRAKAMSGETAPLNLIPTTASTSQLFVLYDRASTTTQGTERPMLMAVDITTAKSRINGIVSPGWYRFFKYLDKNNDQHIHLELLACVKTMTLSPEPTPVKGGVYIDKGLSTVEINGVVYPVIIA